MRRKPFNIKGPFVAAREFIFAGQTFQKGEPFPPRNDFAERLIRQQYESRAIRFATAEEAEDDEPAEQVTMTPAARNGSYDISAPWLEKPETVKGKVNAEKRLAAIREAGPPEGWIDPNVENPDVLVSVEDGGKHVVTAPWGKPEVFDTAEAAEARQAELRKEGPPEGWTPPAQ